MEPFCERFNCANEKKDGDTENWITGVKIVLNWSIGYFAIFNGYRAMRKRARLLGRIHSVEQGKVEVGDSFFDKSTFELRALSRRR